MVDGAITDVLWWGHFHFVFPIRDGFMEPGSWVQGLKKRGKNPSPLHSLMHTHLNLFTATGKQIEIYCIIVYVTVITVSDLTCLHPPHCCAQGFWVRLLAAADEMNKCLMALWNTAHFQSSLCSPGEGGGRTKEGREPGEDLLQKSSVHRGKQQAHEQNQADTFPPNVILLKGTNIKGKVNSSQLFTINLL